MGIPYISAANARECAVNHLLKNPHNLHDNKMTQLFEFVDKHEYKDWNSYLTATRKQATFGDNLTMQALSSVYNTRILVVTAATSESLPNYHLLEPTGGDPDNVLGTIVGIIVSPHTAIMSA
jgi:hypothetical protein